MNAGLLVKLRPTGPWRIGSDTGARNRVDSIYHSDSLYAAVTSTMSRLGMFEEWLNATARGGPPAVAFASCFPFLDNINLVTPPLTHWPPTSPALMAARLRWKSARFVPLTVVQALISGQPLDENEWWIDGPSQCLLPNGRLGPFRSGLRSSAAVDRLTGATERHSTACTEFRSGAGLWTIVGFADDAARDRWQDPVKTAFRWLADSGFGGERSRGWGRSESPEFVEGELPGMILQVAPRAEGDTESAGPLPHWLLSLFAPDPADQVDWSRGNYSLLARAGRVDSSGELKKSLQMVAEGSVLYAVSALRGAAPDVAPEGCAHPVYRAGFAVAIPLPEAS
jgi:CRISPR type III-A-associated RAMP protein Csm4